MLEAIRSAFHMLAAIAALSVPILEVEPGDPVLVVAPPWAGPNAALDHGALSGAATVALGLAGRVAVLQPRDGEKLPVAAGFLYMRAPPERVCARLGMRPRVAQA